MQMPTVVMAAPVRDVQGKVIGALMGATDLGTPNFLDVLMRNPYGKSGGYVLVARKQGVIIDATDKRRILQPVGDSRQVQRYVEGYEGSGIHTNRLGVEVLTSARAIPSANWFLAATLPTTEAFAPLDDMHKRMATAAIVLSALACGLIWWFLRRQLYPVLATVDRLSRMADETIPVQTLPVGEVSEVGELIGGVNRVLKTLEQREHALRESKEFGHTILNSVFAEIAVLDRSGVIRAVNQPWMRYSVDNGLVPGVAAPRTGVGTDYLQICRAAAGSKDEGLAWQACNGIQGVLDGSMSQFTLEYPCDTADVQSWFRLVVTPLDLPEHGAVVAHENITLRKRAELALFESEKRFELFMDALPAAAFIKDGAGGTLFVNRYMEETLGSRGWRTQSTAQLFPPEIAAKMIDDDRRAIDAGNLVVEEAVPGADGAVRLYETHKFAIPQTEGASLLGGIAIDITERKQAENNLRTARQEADAAKTDAESANDAKSRFLAAASHDLRQPLAALSLYVEMLNNPAAADKHQLASRIRACVVNLNELLDDVLDVSKLDAGVVVPVWSSFSLKALSRDLMRTHGPMAATKGLSIHWEPSDFIVQADRILLQRMLGNLIHNAVKFTEQGGVLIAYRRLAGRHWIEVSDTGTGIAQDRLPTIFGNFGQSGNSVRNRGSGLGLAIVAKTAAVMGLQLRVESRMGRGSMFAIELLEGSARPRVEPASVASDVHPLTLGVVDDNPQVLDALELALKAAGHAVFCGSSGKEMLERLDGRIPDAIVSDYRLSETESGFDVIAAARAAFGSGLPGIIITGDTDPALLRTMRQRGIEILYKPVDMDALNASIRRHTQTDL